MWQGIKSLSTEWRTRGKISQLASFLDTKLSIFSESFSKRIVVDLKLSHAIILCKEKDDLLSTVLRIKGEKIITLTA